MWLRRYEELGLRGLRDPSRRTLASTNATRSGVVRKIAYLRPGYHFAPDSVAL